MKIEIEDFIGPIAVGLAVHIYHCANNYHFTNTLADWIVYQQGKGKFKFPLTLWNNRACKPLYSIMKDAHDAKQKT